MIKMKMKGNKIKNENVLKEMFGEGKLKKSKKSTEQMLRESEELLESKW